jgi:hypothetical protein
VLGHTYFHDSGSPPLVRDLEFIHKCYNWTTLFDEPQAEARICKKRDSDRSAGPPNPKGNPNQESTRRAFFRFPRLFAGLQDATRIWNPMVLKAKLERHSMRRKVGCKGHAREKITPVSSRQQPNCTCIFMSRSKRI